MVLPDLMVGSSPAAETVVGFPLWLWVDRSGWEPVSATAAVSTGSVTVTATPGGARWAMGDGTTLDCPGPGTVFVPDRHEADAPSPDCGHTYARASRGQAAGRFPVTVTVTWSVEWSSTAGGGGTLDPLTTSASRAVRVAEVHALVTDG
ncbi:hypothetical protein [Nocardiopsis tropica]|uniref:ATP/GTP-binding protein n=1 Tax=Nocardiopsis tropica TaxID=109330 RepID=A0ABV2A088_9ACTN